MVCSILQNIFRIRIYIFDDILYYTYFFFFLELCSGMKFPKDTEYECSDRKGRTTNCSDAVDGTLLSFSCPHKYRTPDGLDHDTRICVKGTWGTPEPNCIRISKSKFVSPKNQTSITLSTSVDNFLWS